VILTTFELVVIGAAVIAVLMAGSMQLRSNLIFYSIQTLLISLATALTAHTRAEVGLYYVAGAIALVKGLCIPLFLNWTIDRVKIQSDTGALIPAPIAMHLSIVLLGLSYLCVIGLPVPVGDVRGWPGATAATSLLLTGLVLMLSRRVAISQILGFLVLENGIYLFALTQTRGMPMIVEMGVLLDVLVGVMIAGLLVFRIQRSFEHIDVTQLADLKD
jgi:hydrogenase-4 component E